MKIDFGSDLHEFFFCVLIGLGLGSLTAIVALAMIALLSVQP